jgi:isoleucyl-tRNA synthetase
VDDRGCLTAECGVPELVGQYVFKANPLIIKMLEDRKMLFAQEEYRHEYPHCWRSKTPIVFRAVKQWFIKVDAFRAEALEQIGQVQWIPANGQNRIRGAVESRPDWCISRQRTWGVPLPVFYGEGGQPLLSPRAVRAFADLAEKEGAGVWFSRSADELAVALNAQAPGLNLPLGLRKGRDTLDVWIDSGTSWAAVLKRHPDLTFPADLYLEGSDQHRGWFQSSLLTSVAVTGRAPYRAVLTNGFVVDQDRKKLSKSGEGYQKPVDLMTLVNEHGADVLRLWVASQDYQDDIPFSHDILARVADSYRSIRNTLRILLGNLSDFDPAKDAVARDQWLPLDEYMDSRWREVCAEILAGYAEYDFARVYQAVNRFCAVDLSAFYVDVLKDRLYCDAPKSALRRSAQTVLHRIAEGLIKLLAPVLPFTAEEAWKELGRVDSVHLEAFPAREEHLRRDWTARMGLRDEVNAKLELARKEKRIGKSLEAVIGIPKLPSLDGLTPRDLDEFFAVSGVTVHDAADIRVARAEDEGLKKCIRCWKYYPEIGSDPAHPELCARCTAVVLNWVGEGK